VRRLNRHQELQRKSEHENGGGAEDPQRLPGIRIRVSQRKRGNHDCQSDQEPRDETALLPKTRQRVPHH
jgi:hypothetical protein